MNLIKKVGILLNLIERTALESPVSVVGIDRCKIGWLAVYLNGSRMEAQVFETIEQVLITYSECRYYFIDIPIGLPRNISEANKRPEPDARKLLKGRASTVFNAPALNTLSAKTYEIANEWNRRDLGKGLSKQSFYLIPPIKEVHEFLIREPTWQTRLFEAHPEVCFKVMGKREPDYSKHTEAGALERRIILKEININHMETFEQLLRSSTELQRYQIDLTDALCLAIAAEQSNIHGMATLPVETVKNKAGQYMQMVYPRNTHYTRKI